MEEEKLTEVVDGGDVDKQENLDEDENVTAEVFNETNNLVEETREHSFYCNNPQNRGGHIVYSCKGVDKDGNWEGIRRYNEFHKLHEKLQERWPGIPIPCLPPKKAIGNKDVKFINERRFYLERFLKKMSPFDFLLNSTEFKMFSRPNGDIEKIFGNLPRIATSEQVNRYQECLGIEYHLYDPIQKDKLDQQCKEFQSFSKQIIPILKNMVTHIALYMATKSQSIQDYKVYMHMLNKYEEINLNTYVEGANTKMVFHNESSKGENTESTKDLYTQMCDSLKNPYFNLYHWCKGELFDIEAVASSLITKDKLHARIAVAEKKKRSTQNDLDNITTGRKTVTTLMKNKGDTGAMVAKIEGTDKEIEALNTLYDIITIYLGEKIVPTFKSKKIQIYSKIVQQFNVMQINNAHQVASFWSQVLSNPNIKAAEDGGAE